MSGLYYVCTVVSLCVLNFAKVLCRRKGLPTMTKVHCNLEIFGNHTLRGPSVNIQNNAIGPKPFDNYPITTRQN